ncbi:MAG: gliding motility-associated C-terminal domain-containing protein [Flavobacteriales bacterium]|nr:gliding motility-associated C-terminal domain-containing protein [Flavobacteriales bacterium]
MWRSLCFVPLFSGLVLFAQPPNDDCSDALTLCADQPLVGNNTGATGAPGFCPGTSSVLWYTFTTNSLGGAVNISLSTINCPSVAGMDNELSLIVLNGDGSCQLGQFTAASTCEQDSLDFTLTTPSLMPNTTYWLLVGGVANNGASIPAQCDFSLTMNGPGVDIVDVDFDAGPSVEIGNGEFTQLEAIGGTTYLWTPNSGLSGDNIADPIASPSETTTYTVTTEINDCIYSDQLIVEVIRRIDPPNTFTPNGDSYNDTWRIFGIEDYPSCEVLIYNRWGQRVFRSVGYREPWDGDRLPMATYYYHIELNQLEGRSAPYTGSVTIVR